MKCPGCGRENRGKAGYCAWCGLRLTSKAEVSAGEPAKSDASQAEAMPPPPQGEMPPKKRTSPRGETPPEGSRLPVAPVGTPTVKLIPPAEIATDQDAAPVAAEEAGPTLQIGQLLAGRYEIRAVAESGPDYNTYQAVDLVACPSCNYEGNEPDDEYCSECGSTLRNRQAVTIVEQLRHPPAHYERRFSQNERDYFVMLAPEPAAPEPASGGALRLSWGRATDQGRQRDHNEDYLEGWLYTRGWHTVVGLFVVADGLGGQDSGEVASQMTTEQLWHELRHSVWEPVLGGETLDADRLSAALRAAVQKVNRAVYDARSARSSQMSSTLTMALVVDGRAYIANVGDSRTYLWGAEGLRRVTRDHSLVQRLVDTGQIKPEEVYSHPQRNLIYQSMGDRPEVQVDLYQEELHPDDRLVLCSDGLWEMVRDDGLEEVLLAEPDPQRACDRLVADANLAGGEDNITVIIVQAVAT